SIPPNPANKRPAVSKHLTTSRKARALRSHALPAHRRLDMRARLPVLLVLVCLASVLLPAQERGVIVVDVKDTSGGVIPGATVMIARAESNADFRKCISDQRGVCAFVGVLPGTYRVQAELSGFRTSLQLVNLSAGQTLRVSSILQVS